GGLFRFDKYYIGNKRFELLASKALNLSANFFPFLRRKIPNRMLPYAGSAWIILDMYALNYILLFVDANPEYFNYHRNTFVADEAFVHMIIGNSNDKELISRTENIEKHFIIWPNKQSAHPKILDNSDFDAIKLSGHLFARKFDEHIDSKILDLIDRNILDKN
ncbi:MAG: hypothetical protein EOO47_18375, partial [Flavobacterium sp.]